MFVKELPEEVILHIVTYLNIEDIATLGSTSKYLRTVVTSDPLWNLRLKKQEKGTFKNYIQKVFNQSQNMFQIYTFKSENGSKFSSFCPYTRIFAKGNSAYESLDNILKTLGFISNRLKPARLTKELPNFHQANQTTLEKVEEFIFANQEIQVISYLLSTNKENVLYCPDKEIFVTGLEIEDLISEMETKLSVNNSKFLFEFQDRPKDVICTALHKLNGNEYAINLKGKNIEWRKPISSKRKRFEFYFSPNKVLLE